MFVDYNVLISWLLVLVMAYDQYSDYNLNHVKVLFFSLGPQTCHGIGFSRDTAPGVPVIVSLAASVLVPLSANVCFMVFSFKFAHIASCYL
jgi:hypothetical protein